jgi:hypothetical protein
MADWGCEGGRPDPAILRSASGRASNRVLSLCAAALLSLPTLVYLHYYEGGASNQFFVWSVTLTLGAWIVLAFRRILVASVLVNALVGIVATASWAKQQAMDMALHAYDVVFYLSSWATIDYLWNSFRIDVVGAGNRDCRLRRLSARCHAGVARQRIDRGRRSHHRRRCRRGVQGGTAAYPVLLGRFSHLVVLFVLGRDRRDAMARPAHRSGQFRAWPAFCGADRLRDPIEASAYHSDPGGISGAAGVFPGAALRPIASIRSLPRKTARCTACGWKPMAGGPGSPNLLS